MKLSDAQWAFLEDFGRLISFIKGKGYKATGGELERTEYQQAEYIRTGKSKKAHSNHQDKLAVDINIFDPSGNVITGDKSKMRQFGDYWESLAPGINVWGGYYKEHYNSDLYDPYHFERKPPK